MRRFGVGCLLVLMMGCGPHATSSDTTTRNQRAAVVGAAAGASGCSLLIQKRPEAADPLVPALFSLHEGVARDGLTLDDFLGLVAAIDDAEVERHIRTGVLLLAGLYPEASQIIAPETPLAEGLHGFLDGCAAGAGVTVPPLPAGM